MIRSGGVTRFDYDPLRAGDLRYSGQRSVLIFCTEYYSVGMLNICVCSYLCYVEVS